MAATFFPCLISTSPRLQSLIITSSPSVSPEIPLPTSIVSEPQIARQIITSCCFLFNCSAGGGLYTLHRLVLSSATFNFHFPEEVGVFNTLLSLHIFLFHHRIKPEQRLEHYGAENCSCAFLCSSAGRLVCDVAELANRGGAEGYGALGMTD